MKEKEDNTDYNTHPNLNHPSPVSMNETTPLLSSAAAGADSVSAHASAHAHAHAAAAPLQSNKELLWAILKLSGPISLMTVVEFLPQILISAMVGHAPPVTALPGGGEDAAEGAVLATYGLANLVYSTCAFATVYGFVCGLDSVAAASYGMTMECGATGETVPVTAASEFSVPPSLAHSTSLVSRKIAWTSPALKGIYLTPRLRRCKTNTHYSRPLASTPGRYPLDHTVSLPIATVFRRSPSVPGNLALAKSPTSLLGGVEERSAFGAWKRKPDEGIDGPDTPEEEEVQPPIVLTSTETSLNLSQADDFFTLNVSNTIQTAVVQPRRQMNVSISPLTLAHSKSTSNTPNDLPLNFHSIQTVEVITNNSLDGTSPFRPYGIDRDVTSPITPAMSPVAPNGVHHWDMLPSNGETLSSTFNDKHMHDKGELPTNLIGVWIRRCLMLELLVVLILILLLYFGCAPLLRALGEPAESIEASSQYVHVVSIGLPFVAIYHSLNKGLQSSGIVYPVLAIAFIVKLFSCIAVYFGLFHYSMSLLGIAWILTIGMGVQAISVYIYMSMAGIVKQWWGSESPVHLLSVDADTSESWFNEYWHGLCEYSALAFPACAAICLEFWLFDILGALAGLLPNPSLELSVHYLLFTSMLASYMVFSGLSVSVSVLVGQKLGAPGQSRNAKQSAIVGTTACLAMSAMLILCLMLFHDEVGRALTSQATLLARFKECVPVLIAYQCVDGINTCATQLLRTLGVQKYGVLLHFTTYYIIGMSTGTILGFHYELGVFGLWVGLCLGVGMNACIATVWLWFHADWAQQCEAAQQRTANLQESPKTSPAAPTMKGYQSTVDVVDQRAENIAHHGV